MTVFYLPIPSTFGQNVQPSAGAKLFFFEEGTSTPKSTFTDPEETIPHTDPVIADGRGRFTTIFLSGSYDVELKDRNDVLIWKAEKITNPGLGGVNLKGEFDSSTNSGSYPAIGTEGDLFVVSTGFTLTPTSGSHVLQTRDFILANKDSTGGGDADWDIIRGVNISLADIVLQAWVVGRDYVIDDYLRATDGNIYRVKADHTSSLGNEPTVGTTPNSLWDPFGQLVDVLDSTDVTRGATGRVAAELEFNTNINPRTFVSAQEYGISQLVNVSQIYSSKLAVNQGNTPLASPAAWRFLLQPPGIDYEEGTDPLEDIKFLGGVFTFDDNSGQAQGEILNKKMNSTWAPGDNAGGMANGIVKDIFGLTFHFFALSSFDQLITDYAFDSSITGANIVADATITTAFGGLTPKKERIGSMRIPTGFTTNRLFTQQGKITLYKSMVQETSQNPPASGKNLQSLNIPVGIQILTNSSFTLEKDGGTAGNTTHGFIRPALQLNNGSPNSGSFNIAARHNQSALGYYGTPLLTDTSGQIATEFTGFLDGNLTYQAYTYGYDDFTLRR